MLEANEVKNDKNKVLGFQKCPSSRATYKSDGFFEGTPKILVQTKQLKMARRRLQTTQEMLNKRLEGAEHAFKTLIFTK
jgi:hypothetical protein